MRKLGIVTILAVASFILAPVQSQAFDCSWWASLWNNCDRAAKDFTCYQTVTIAVEVGIDAGPGSGSVSYQEVSVAAGNRIDCVVGGDVCREEGGC